VRAYRLFVACLAATVAAGVAASTQSPVPEEVRRLLSREFTFTDAQIAAARSGQPVVASMASSVAREVAVVGAVRIAAPASRMVAMVRDIERLERGKGFLATHKFSSPPSLADVATLRLPDGDIEDLRSCRPGRCAVKLGRGAFDDLARVDWRAPNAAEQVNGFARRMAVSYVEQYKADGNKALAVYVDTPDPIDIAKEIDDMVRRSSVLTSTLPEVSRYLLAYPAGRPASVDDFFYWSLAEFGLKPVLRLNHTVIHPTGTSSGLQYAITTKQLYASHYFHAALDVRVLLDDPEQPGRAHYLIMLSLARADGLTGIFGGVVKRKVTSGGVAGVRATLAAMKNRAEGR